jgi:hypothetical protein
MIMTVWVLWTASLSRGVDRATAGLKREIGVYGELRNESRCRVSQHLPNRVDLGVTSLPVVARRSRLHCAVAESRGAPPRAHQMALWKARSGGER